MWTVTLIKIDCIKAPIFFFFYPDNTFILISFIFALSHINRWRKSGPCRFSIPIKGEEGQYSKKNGSHIMDFVYFQQYFPHVSDTNS